MALLGFFIGAIKWGYVHPVMVVNTMSPIKAELLKTIETAPNTVVEQTLAYLKTLLTDRGDMSAAFQPKTNLGKQLWEIRQRAIANGMNSLTESEIAQELADRRGGDREF